MDNREVNTITEMHQFIEKYNFATLVTYENDEFYITHVPVMLDRTQGPYGTIMGHMAKMNSHLNAFDCNNNTVCIFKGPHAYISPTWYKSSPNVPTWNYAVVHVYGKPNLISKDQLSLDLTKMVEHHESMPGINSNYIISDEYKNRLMDHIVGFRIEILKIEHKFKLGQNKNANDQEGMLNGLREQNTYETMNFLDFCESYLKSK